MSEPAEAPYPDLARIAAMPDPAARAAAAEKTVSKLLGALDGDRLAVQRIRAEVRRLRLMPMGMFDELARPARAVGEHQGDAPAAPNSPPAAPASGITRNVPGSAGWRYCPAEGDYPGELWTMRGKAWVCVLSWVPVVTRRLMTPSPDGGATALYYEIAAAGCSAIASGDELASGEVWRLLPAEGTGAKAVREVLANIVQAEAMRLELAEALTRTGWHAAADGARFYVFADGRASDGRGVVLVGKNRYARLAAAARPVAEADPSKVAGALWSVAENGRGPGLLGVGIGVRALAHSLHRVPGGFIAVGRPNAGKSSLGWHARSVIVARSDRADAWPPLPSATFADTKTSIEAALDYEADMPTLIDDAALTDKSSRAEIAEVTARLEMIFRSLANDAAVRNRMDRTMLPREARYIRAPAIATIQGSIADAPVQNSLLRRVVLLPVDRGDIDLKWYRKHSADLVAPLRALGEHLVIPRLAALADGAPAYVAAKDAEAREMLGAALEALMPGWEDSAEGLAGVADIAACALAGLLIACELADMSPDLVTFIALPYLASAIAAQAGRMGDSATEATPVEALGEIIRAALLDQRAHVRDHQGDAAAAIPGLTEQEQGVEAVFTRDDGCTVYRGRGVPFYWLPDDAGGVLGVRAESLHKLIRASGDTRLPVHTARALPAYLIAEGAAVPSSQRTTNGTHQKRIGADKMRLVYLRADILASTTENCDSGSGTSGTSGTAQVGGIESNGIAESDTDRSGTPQVNGGFAPSAPKQTPLADFSKDDSYQESTVGTGSIETETVPAHADVVPTVTACLACGERLHRYLIQRRAEYHINCMPDEVFSQWSDGSPSGLAALVALSVPDSGRSMGGPMAGPRDDLRKDAEWTAGPPVADSPETSGPAPVSVPGEVAPGVTPRRRWVVLGGDGRAYAADAEIIELPEGALERCVNVGELAALALELGAERCYVPAAARQALGLPASLPDVAKPTEGHPHMWTESTDTGRWDIWPAEPVGLAPWMVVYRRPKSGEGAAIAFPEWLVNTPALGELDAPELARALELIHLATTHHGEGKGGVEFYRSPAATFGRLLDKAARFSRAGRPEAIELPPPYIRTARRPKGAPAALRAPGAHMAPDPAEIPPGYILARLDVRSCFASAATGTDFGIGEAVHTRAPAEIGKAPGAHLVRVPAAAAVHPQLTPFALPPSGKAREVLAWLDTLAARWLAENKVPLTVIESWTWPEKHRVFDSAVGRLGEARTRLEAAGDVPSLAAAAVVKAMANTFLGGWLGSDFGGDRRADDWTARRDWWLTIRVQAEVRKQRNLLPMIGAGAVVLGSQQVDSVYVAAPSLEALEAMPGTGGRPAIADGRGKFKLEQHTEVTPELSAVLADPRGNGRARLAVIRTALDNEEK